MFASALIYFGILLALRGLNRGEINFFISIITGSLRKLRGKHSSYKEMKYMQ